MTVSLIDGSLMEMHRTRVRHDRVLRHELRDIEPDFDYLAETFVTDHEEVVAGRRLTVFPCVDFLVPAIDADT